MSVSNLSRSHVTSKQLLAKWELPAAWTGTYVWSPLDSDFTARTSHLSKPASLLWAHTIYKDICLPTPTTSRLHHPHHPPPSRFASTLSCTCSHKHANWHSPSLRVWGAGWFGTAPQLMERQISSCMHSFGLLESFRPIRSHWSSDVTQWADNTDHVQITILSLSQTLRSQTRPFCEESISWI